MQNYTQFLLLAASAAARPDNRVDLEELNKTDYVYWKHSDQVLSRKDTSDFISFAAKFNKHFADPQDLGKRMSNWKQSVKVVNDLNALRMGATFGENFTSDLDDDEYRLMLGLDPNLTQEASRPTTTQHESESDEDDRGRRLAGSSINWVKKGKVVGVKDQGECTACWIFAAATAMESAKAIKDNSNPFRLSEQQNLDCDPNTTCTKGRQMDFYWQYSKEKGSMLNRDYPYIGKVGKCQYDEKKIFSRASKWGYVPESKDDIAKKLQEGPLTAAVSAESPCWRYYQKGVLASSYCTTNLDHAVTIVGYEAEPKAQNHSVCRYMSWFEMYLQRCFKQGSVEKRLDPNATSGQYQLCCDDRQYSQPYFLMQNSWGTNWGESGFIKLAAQDGLGTSGMNQVVQFVTTD